MGLTHLVGLHPLKVALNKILMAPSLLQSSRAYIRHRWLLPGKLDQSIIPNHLFFEGANFCLSYSLQHKERTCQGLLDDTRSRFIGKSLHVDTVGSTLFFCLMAKTAVNTHTHLSPPILTMLRHSIPLNVSSVCRDNQRNLLLAEDSHTTAEISRPHCSLATIQMRTPVNCD